MENLPVENMSAEQMLQESISVETDELKNLGSEFIPLLTVASSLSGVVDAEIARPGEFVLAQMTSLGDNITAIPLAFRLHSQLVQNNPYNVIEARYVSMGVKSAPADFREFSNMQPPAGHKIEEGSDMFFYLPEQKSFAQIYLKNTLAKFSDPIWQAGKGGRVLGLKTALKTNSSRSRKWYDIIISPTNNALQVSQLKDVKKSIVMDMHAYKKYATQFANPPKPTIETVNKQINTIER